MADRESDFYEPPQLCQKQGVDFVVRACHDRRLDQRERHLRETVAGGQVLGQSAVETRARAGPAARTALVAVRLLSAKLRARRRPQSGKAAASFGPEILRLLQKKLGEPKDGWTHRNFIRAVARVGGFIGRKSDGEPGWQTIWRGWQRLMWMCAGVNLGES